MSKIRITTSKETAVDIEKFFQSISAHGRSITLKDICHFEGYSDVIIGPAKEGEMIKPEDLFWMGYYSHMFTKQNQ